MPNAEETEQRLVRIETRMVKYQEANVQQFMGILQALDDLVAAIETLNQSITKVQNDEQ